MVFSPADLNELREGVKACTSANGIDSTTSCNHIAGDVVASGTGKYGKISEWDVSRVTDMSKLFSEVSDGSGSTATMEDWNDDLSKWNVGKVTNMYGMFMNCLKFNSDLSKWNVGSVVYEIKMIREPDQEFGLECLILQSCLTVTYQNGK